MAEPGTVLESRAALDAFHGDVPPRQGAWSDEDYLRLTDCVNRLVEFTDGYVRGQAAGSGLLDGLAVDVAAVFDSAGERV